MIVYLDDILIFTQTLKDYYKIVHRVSKILARYKLFLYFKKYKTIVYLHYTENSNYHSSSSGLSQYFCTIQNQSR